MKRLLIIPCLLASPVWALSGDFDEQVDRAIAEASDRTDAKFKIEEYKEGLVADLAKGRAEFEDLYPCARLLRLAGDGFKLEIRLIYAKEYGDAAFVKSVTHRLWAACDDILNPKPPPTKPLVIEKMEWLIEANKALKEAP